MLSFYEYIIYDDYDFEYMYKPEKICKMRDLFPLPAKVIGKVERFIHNTHSIRKLLPVGHRYRGDVEVL
jgi:hypothetical protein